MKVALGEEKAYAIPFVDEGRDRPLPGAAGAVQAYLLDLSPLDRGLLPPTINDEVPDPECDLDYIPNEAREVDVEIAVLELVGLGGDNACTR